MKFLTIFLVAGNILLHDLNVAVVATSLHQGLRWNSFLKEGLARTILYLGISIVMQLALSFFAMLILKLLLRSPPPRFLLAASLVYNILCVGTILTAIACSFNISGSIHQLSAATAGEIWRLMANFQQEEARTALDILQRNYRCCGTQGYDHWRRLAVNLTQVTASDTCCLSKLKGAACTEYQQVGCVAALRQYFHRILLFQNLYLMSTVTVVFFLALVGDTLVQKNYATGHRVEESPGQNHEGGV